MSDSGVQKPKQPYSPPTLVIYGDVVLLTQGSAVAANQPDGGKGIKTRTR